MESTPDTAQMQASIEASEWLIRLQEDLHDPAVQAEFRAWISASPANKSAWAETRALARFALSLEPDAPLAILPSTAPVAMTVVEPFSSSQLIADLPHVPDAAKLFGMGTLLLGLAAAVRRVS